MAVYVTKDLLSKFNKVKYPYISKNEDEGTITGDHWQQLVSDSKKSVDLAKDMICRVCAKSGCTPLRDRIYGIDIMSALRSITNVTIEIDDSLPKYICTDCLEVLKTALTFKFTCESSEKKFKKILNPMGDPSLHSYPYSKHDFQMILNKMKLKRVKIEELREKERQKKERLMNKKSSKTKQIKCSPCDITFSDKDKLIMHRRESQCMRRACDVCGELVLSIAQHMRHIHKEIVMQKCVTCNKEFQSVTRLKNHMRVHTNTFNFFCDLCPYRSKYKYYLVMHMRTHTGEKPYKCPECPATFVNPSNLNKHKLTHQEKQFKCQLCEKAFRTNTALREHHQATHMNIKHTCNYCGRDFCYKSDLRKHEIRYHNRIKRDYIGGEPTYKQVERMQKIQENSELTYKQVDRIPKLQESNEVLEEWRTDGMQVVNTTAPIIQATYIDQSKKLIQMNHAIYFSDVSGFITQPQMGQQQTVEITLPELTLKKDDVKLYETQQTIGYF
ncbi:hypothetical protein K1T71_007309 [Dendrolimus kikuchii]|uniref:Uncharacterized protein n=1 Tax=Dendrolimus kikuchii TaxID=765133 RepID=A0ACC1D0A1_9NEOP|nr:hypothetical protein K1T71_007309 [Dendrolimus kikuchii]